MAKDEAHDPACPHTDQIAEQQNKQTVHEPWQKIQDVRQDFEQCTHDWLKGHSCFSSRMDGGLAPKASSKPPMRLITSTSHSPRAFEDKSSSSSPFFCW